MPAPPEARARVDVRGRRLSLFDVLCIGVNATVGSGVFALPDDLHRAMGGFSPLAYVLCTVLLLPVALSFAELSGRLPETGGAYVYARHAFGDRVGFLIGWYCWANTFVSWAANTTLFIELCGVPAFPYGKVLAVFVIVALGVVNYVGVKPGAFVVNAVVVGKLAAILCFVAVAVLAFQPHHVAPALPLGLAGVGQGTYLALFPLQGFEVTPVTAGETANPRRNVPLGTIGALALSALLFVVVQLVIEGAYPLLDRDSQTPLVDAARYLGPTIGVVVFVGSMVSIGGFTAGSALGSPRYAQAIAADGLLPAALARVHRRFATPHVAIVVTTGLTAVLAVLFDYRKLVGMSNITVCVQYLAACVALPIVRRRFAEGPRTFVIPGGDVVPVLGALGSLALFASAGRDEYVFAAATLVVGVAIAVASRRERRTPT
ncbi:MAG TPA: APC family permease [Minicystis sp.]|nr:APC family permease [Minicystis sp.]